MIEQIGGHRGKVPDFLRSPISEKEANKKFQHPPKPIKRAFIELLKPINCPGVHSKTFEILLIHFVGLFLPCSI